MPLNVVSNYAANVAHRNLQMNDTAASNSLAKLSVGKRVVNARDDAASMAIGQRLNAEVMGLKQAVVNSGQANSMLQIADGAMSTASDILTRMKVLAIQSSSANLSTTERDFLDTEYQALFAEIDRIADDTDFAGTKLLDGAVEITAATGFAVANGVASITAQGIGAGTATSGAQYSISFDYDSTANTAAFYITTAEGSYSGAINTEVLGTDGALLRATAVLVEGSGTAPAPGSFTIAINTAFDSNTDIAAVTQAFSGSSSLSLTFKLGTGTESEDSLSFTLDAINTTSLGLFGSTLDTVENASAALELINNAIDTLNEFRSDVGAAQNRLDFASSNLNISVENAEAARSTLVDLDLAQEMTSFSSKQVLMQAGVAMLAQANQMPQNLLRLLQ
ncbi:MAG: flagellin [Alphaproteobacteria bacterium]